MSVWIKVKGWYWYQREKKSFLFSLILLHWIWQVYSRWENHLNPRWQKYAGLTPVSCSVDHNHVNSSWIGSSHSLLSMLIIVFNQVTSNYSLISTLFTILLYPVLHKCYDERQHTSSATVSKVTWISSNTIWHNGLLQIAVVALKKTGRKIRGFGISNNKHFFCYKQNKYTGATVTQEQHCIFIKHVRGEALKTKTEMNKAAR